ncbi:OsmC family protein [Nitriliruptor alkaliphilus]|uniref:OsmC family protein n=1 Tax=Nitriliruptor alkaliphilus TaxID=427918 RepID=UPI001B809F68|nr:OsmC family protein [Nitriliruptor alkaliphilus]
MSTMTTTDTHRNGVDTGTLYATLDAIAAQPDLARFQFRADNEWKGGAHNRSTIQSFYGAGAEDSARQVTFQLDAGEPALLLGQDEGPNPAEFALHALAACLTTTLVYVAAARKVTLTRVTSHLEGDLDVRGALGIDDEVRNGFQAVRVRFTVEGDAPEEKLRELVARAQARSVVFDTFNNPVDVTVEVDTP